MSIGPLTVTLGLDLGTFTGTHIHRDGNACCSARPKYVVTFVNLLITTTTLFLKRA